MWLWYTKPRKPAAKNHHSTHQIPHYLMSLRSLFEDLREAVSNEGLTFSKQSLNNIIFISFTDKKIHSYRYVEKIIQRMTD